MAGLLVLTAEPMGSVGVLPALALLSHPARVAPLAASSLVDPAESDVVVVDARRDLATARSLCRLAAATSLPVPLLAVCSEGGLTAVTGTWGLDDFILDTAGPAEVEARLRLLTGPGRSDSDAGAELVEAGEILIDTGGYIARVHGRALDLTFKEFELLKHLVRHPDRVFTRGQLLQEVWGYEYYGGTRTVDVHVRRLRAKLGPEHDHLIGTVRGVGYRFSADPSST
ncbi:response regulator transcription factor [Georgenia sunbinii]|uniref:response regulator transcription factor n=1 Tax=Georgenia sunbinii TaxID=3117728 RepID=UPI002F25FA31